MVSVWIIVFREHLIMEDFVKSVLIHNVLNWEKEKVLM